MSAVGGFTDEEVSAAGDTGSGVRCDCVRSGRRESTEEEEAGVSVSSL